MKVLNMYCSMSGNTKKIAQKIEETVKELNHEVVTFEVKANQNGDEIDYLDYDFLFIGCGVYSWLPPQPMTDFVTKLNKVYVERKKIQCGSPRLPGKYCVTYATFGGPHTGVNEAVITPKYLWQLPDHLGFEVVEEWQFPGAFPASMPQALSTAGRMGDITGRPNAQDLENVKNLVKGIMTIHGAS